MPIVTQAYMEDGAQKCRLWLASVLPTLSEDPTHPAQVALRTYALALSLSLGPALIPFVTSVAKWKKSPRASWGVLKKAIKREVWYDGFASAMTTSVAGGAALRHAWNAFIVDEGEGGEEAVAGAGGSDLLASASARLGALKERLRSLNLTPTQVTFLCNVLASSVGVVLLQKGAFKQLGKGKSKGNASPTLDLTLLLVIRALDSLIQSSILRRTQPRPAAYLNGTMEPMAMVKEKLEREQTKRVNARRQRMTEKIDAFLFWACSSRIMWCWFYEPWRLPGSYVKWINAVAHLDGRVPAVLRLVRTKEWSYINGSPKHADLLHDFVSKSLNLPASWGNPNDLPAYGGAIANEAWKKLGVTNRRGVGGLPCELVHGKVGQKMGSWNNCHTNAAMRWCIGFGQAFLIYAPVHLFPTLVTRPQTLLRPARLLAILTGALRSTAFLASFISLYWYTVCLSRTLVLARLLPFVSHDFWDGPFGGILAGSLACGASIWIENGRRRGEMALYVLPRALRTCLPEWLVRSRGWKSRLVERVAFVLSISSLLTAAIDRPDSLRGLSRWALAFVMNGPNAGFWKRKLRDPSIPPTPSVAPTPYPKIVVVDHDKDSEKNKH